MTRLDQALVARGLARSRSHAAQLIAAGRVRRAGVIQAKAASKVQDFEELAVDDGGAPDFVSRAGVKLDGALRSFTGVAVEGKRCLDAGASTGGFTEVLLRAGASRVAAVDVGHGQLVADLRRDPRVDVVEGLNVRQLEPDAIGGQVDLTVADLSFISLTLVLLPLARATKPGGDMVLLIKPQFEVGKGKLNSSGVVATEPERRRAVGQVIGRALAHGLTVSGLIRSQLPGQDGNVEFFVWITVPTGPLVPRIEGELDRMTRQVLDSSTAFTDARLVTGTPDGARDTTELQ
ncbi:MULTISPECIES: TlyA family RNA methyltransferase [unclassified Arthrobacter]|uniref:TlyA family RNA methyltransferase n=1 Tax=unclassified Arthrobacter TaxID=235627 RepID=UPI000401CCAE|nr:MULTISPECIES: TlyA family RNA methyltransferase [unclassified Arthrobacter]PVE15364.1 TlyA family RNA methyltransferase [Arthrobacter sp. Bz4]